MREEPGPGEHVQTASGAGDAELIRESDVTIVVDLDVLFNPDFMAELEGEVPEWIDLSRLVPDFPPAESGEPASEEPPF